MSAEMRPFRRVLVAFDPSPQGQALLELAAELAESFGTPLSGLYLEDEAMISYAASPLANEVTLGTASLRALSSEQMRAHFRVEAGLAGARATAAILAGLPLLGLLLGQALGADPVAFLLSGGAGGWLLLIGSALICAGLLWSDTIIAGVVT